jgi:hypothetical protein
MIYLLNSIIFLFIAKEIYEVDTSEDENGVEGKVTHYFFGMIFLAGANIWMLMNMLGFRL